MMRGLFFAKILNAAPFAKCGIAFCEAADFLITRSKLVKTKDEEGAEE